MLPVVATSSTSITAELGALPLHLKLSLTFSILWRLEVVATCGRVSLTRMSMLSSNGNWLDFANLRASKAD